MQSSYLCFVSVTNVCSDDVYIILRLDETLRGHNIKINMARSV